jgi:hypothetical protein
MKFQPHHGAGAGVQKTHTIQSPIKSPGIWAMPGFSIRSLAVTYFHMGRPHTIIGAEQFHFRVRDGIGWFPLAKAARQTGMEKGTGSISDIRLRS